MRVHDQGVAAPVQQLRPDSSVEDVVLRDGSTLRLRVPTLADETLLIDFFQSLSADSRYLRFHGATTINPQTVAGALETDWTTRGSLLGELADPDGRLRPVALATYVQLHDPSRAEVAFAVADELHGRGIGTRLLERLAAHAASAGLKELVAEVLPRTARCSASSTTPASRAAAPCRAA